MRKVQTVPILHNFGLRRQEMVNGLPSDSSIPYPLNIEVDKAILNFVNDYPVHLPSRFIELLYLLFIAHLTSRFHSSLLCRLIHTIEEGFTRPCMGLSSRNVHFLSFRTC